jgi:RsiW-degrading membrane proteinase PrsW (M82 family)
VANYRSGLLTPPREEEERRLHRPVWRSLIIENATLIGIVVTLYIVQAFIGLTIPTRLFQPVNLLIALLPAGIWMLFSVSLERTYPQPRERLVAVAVLCALLARAIGIPFVEEVLKIDQWLPLSSALNRIIGYAFSVGIVECGLCYLAIRAVAWPDHIRDRYDAIAYAAAAAVGYTLIPNIEFALTGQPVAYVVALNTFANVSALTLTMIFVGYGLAGTLFDGASSILQPATMAIAALILGAAIPLRQGFLNASFSIGGTSLPRYIFAIGFVIAMFTGGVFVLHFLFRFAEKQAAERELGQLE